MPVLALNAATGLEALGTVFTQVMSWISSLVTTITGQPLLLLTVGIMCAGAVICLLPHLNHRDVSVKALSS